MRSAWPTGAELETELTAASITLPGYLTEANVMEIVVAEWEAATGWSPWLEDESADDYDYTMNGTQGLILRSGMTEITAVAVDGSALDTSFWKASPEGAARFTAVLFDGVVASGFGLVTVTGKRGWGDIPEEVWVAVMKRAVSYAADASAQAGSGPSKGPVKREKVGSVEIEYATEGVAGPFDAGLVAKYRRVG